MPGNIPPPIYPPVGIPVIKLFPDDAVAPLNGFPIAVGYYY
jgi:hypothetical protein